jgi:glucokinase
MLNETIYLGIEIGGTKLQLVAGDATGKVINRHRLTVQPRDGAAGIQEQIRQTVAQILSYTRLTAVGVGFGGPVDWRTGKICRSHQVEGWSEFDLPAWLEPLAQAPVFIDNDANVATLGEAIHGAGQGRNPVFYVTLGSGVGGGLVIDGTIYHGATPGEAEIGHIRLDRNGTIIEARCSGWAVDAKIREIKTFDPLSLLAKINQAHPGGEAAHLVAALTENDSTAQRILRETADDLAFGLSHVTQLFHPEIIVIGGGLSNVGEPLRAAVEQALQRYVMDAFAPGPQVCLTTLREDVVTIGALEMARRSVS